MHAYVQRGLLGVLIAGGITLVGATAANADTPSHDAFGQPAGQSQSNEALNLGGNGISLGSISAPITIAGNTLGGGSGSSSNPTAVVSSSSSSAKGSSTIDQSNTAGGSGKSGTDQSNSALNLGGNAVSGPTVSVPITIAGNTVGGGSSHQDGWKPSRSGSSTSNPTTVVSAASSTAKGSSTIDQSNTATTKGGSDQGWKPKGSKSGQSQSNEALNLGGNAVSGPSVSLPVTVAGNTVTGDQGRKHEASTSSSNPTTVVSAASSTAKGSSTIDQSNVAKSSGSDQGWKKNGSKSGQTQSNEATNLGGNGLSLGSLSAPITVSGNTLGGSSSHGDSWKSSRSSSSNPTTVVSTSSSTAKGSSTIDQWNGATSKRGSSDGWKKSHSTSGQSQSNEALNLGGNAVSGPSVSLPVTVAGNTVTGDQGRKHEASGSSKNATTVVSTSTSTAKGSSVIDQSNTAKSNGSDEGWKKSDSTSGQSQSDQAANLGGNGLSLGSLSAPITVSGNTLGGHGGSSSNPTTVVSGSSSAASGSSWIGQSNTAHTA